MDEILITLHLEHTLTKQQIFEDYANEIYFGRRGTYSVNGFGEAARVLFRQGTATDRRTRSRASRRTDPAAELLQSISISGKSARPAQPGSRPHATQRPTDPGRLPGCSRFAPDASAAGIRRIRELLFHLHDERRTAEPLSASTAKQSRSIVTTLDPELQKAAEAAVRSGMDAVDQQLRKRKSPRRPGFGPAAGCPDRPRPAYR